jgi:DNA transformation protein
LCKTGAMDELLTHVTELLSSIGRVRHRRMFGGYGFYVDDIFVAIIARDRLYLKVDDATRAAFETAGCEPFVYDSAGQSVALGYFSAPEEAMESPPMMRPWALQALSAALRARAPKPRAAKPARKAAPRKGSATKAPTKL